MLELINVSKTYLKSKKKAINNINLTIEDGDIYGFIGPNGSGKSTTIKSIVGIHDFEGDIILNGLSIRDNPIEFKKQLAYVPDNPDLYEHLTGIGYIDFICNIYFKCNLFLYFIRNVTICNSNSCSSDFFSCNNSINSNLIMIICRYMYIIIIINLYFPNFT